MPSVYIQSSVFLPTPSGGAGAVELLVAKMAEGLAKRGWDVTLFGLEGSGYTVGPPCPDSLPRLVTIRPEGDAETRERRLIHEMQIQGSPDVIFDHSLHMFAGQRRGPYVAMSHGMAPLPSWAHNVVFTSQHHGRLHKVKNPQALLLGIDLADIPPATGVEREGLFWAGRIMPYKRLHLACEIARLAGQKLRVAGPVVDETYWRHVDSTYGRVPFGIIDYFGELPRDAVLREMAKVRYFLFTSDETEPAGLTMLEAQACGTPVIAINDGSAHEYVGSGYIGGLRLDPIPGAVWAMQIVDRHWKHESDKARQHVESRFTIDHMVDRAEGYLRRAIAGERW